MIPLVVLAVALGTTALLVIGELLLGHRRPLDTEVPERWLVAHAPARLRPLAQRIDRRILGGVAVAASLLVVTAGGVAVGAIFDWVDEDRGLARWDRAAGEFGARHATEQSTRALRWITELGGTVPLLVVMATLGVWQLARRRSWAPLAYLAIVGVGIVAVNNLLKLIVDRERPDIAQLTGHSGTSFPSGHSAAAAACWAAIALVLLRRASRPARAGGAIAAVLVATTVAATRVLLGVHWLTDVVAGVIVGWAWFGVVTLLFGGRLLRFGEPAERIARRAETAGVAAAAGDPAAVSASLRSREPAR